jgi:tyrosine-protein kinase
MQQSSLQNYLQVLRRQAWLILLVPIIAATLAWFVSSRQAPVYRASMNFFVQQSGGGFAPVLGSQSLAQTMSTVLKSDVVANQAIDELNLDTTPEKLNKKLKVTFKPDDAVLHASYDSTSKQRAVAILSSISDAYLRVVKRLKIGGSATGPGGAGQPPPRITATVFDRPHAEKERVSPKPARSVGFAAALGLAIGLILAFARESLDNRIRRRRDAEEWFGAAVIGALPKTATGNPPPAITGQRRRGHEVLMEALYTFRANIEFSQDGLSGPTVLITSAAEGEGKTTVAAHMAVALALAGKEVICVEADFRRPELHRYLGLPARTPGLAEVVAGEVGLAEALQPVKLMLRVGANGRGPWGQEAEGETGIPSMLKTDTRGGLRVLTMGKAPADPNILASDALKELVRALVEDEGAEYVILDAPPLLIADAYPLVRQADNILVVAKQGWTKRDAAFGVRETLEGLGAEKVAIVLSNSTAPVGHGYGYGRTDG